MGSTGSVGAQALDVARFLGLKVDAIAFGSNVRLGEEQIRAFRPKYAAIGDEIAAKSLRIAVRDTDTTVLSGRDCICEMIEALSSDVCINALSGFAGLRPTLAAVRRFPRIGLANKETIVAAGELVMAAAVKTDVRSFRSTVSTARFFSVLREKERRYPPDSAYLFGRSLLRYDAR